MAKARVNLEKALTYEVRGRTFQKGRPQIITSESDIAYFKNQPEFTVTMLKEVAPKPPPTPVVVTPPPAPVVDEEDGEDELEEEVEEEVEDDGTPGGLTRYTAESLGAMTKLELVNLGQGPRFNLALEGSMKKAELVEAILAQQSLEG